MTRLLPLLALLALPAAHAQTADDRDAVRQAVLDYVDAIYQVRPDLAARSVSPDLVKVGYYRPGGDPAQPYAEAPMTYAQLEALARTWNQAGRVDPDSALRRVTVFEVLDQTATAKLDADWGTDFLHLRREDGQWKIIHVLWQELPPAPRAYATDRIPSTLPTISLAEVETQNGRVTDRATGEVVTGLVADDHPEGAPRARYAVVDGLAEGVWVEWYASGAPRYIGTWAAGQGEGVWTYFHETGAIRERSEVTGDVWHGTSEGWHANGQRAYSGTNRWNRRDGVWRFWTEDGTLDRTETYREGQRLQ